MLIFVAICCQSAETIASGHQLFVFDCFYFFRIFLSIFDICCLLHVRCSCCGCRIACCRLISLAFIFGKANATHLPACLPLIFLRFSSEFPLFPSDFPLGVSESKLDSRRSSCRSLVASCCCCRRRHRRCFCLPMAAGHSGSKLDSFLMKLTFQLRQTSF